MSAIEVIEPGVLTTVQDLGRPGWAHVGVPVSGAADPRALDRGNRLVGNDPGAAALEATLIGPRLVFHQAALVAITGAVDFEARHVAAGEELALGPLTAGARAYVCVRGGIDVEPVLGSRSTDLLTRLGPPPLSAGMLLPIGREPAREPERVAAVPRTAPVLRIRPGPRDDWFAADAIDTLSAATGGSPPTRTASGSDSRGRSSRARAATSSCRRAS